jgi:hypothetical protein
MKFLPLALLLFLAGGLVFAQEIKVTVIDRDLDIPLEGVQIIVSGSAAKAVTGPDGNALVALPAGVTRPVMVAVLPGYETQKVTLQPGQKSVTVRMILAGVIEGKELVVERTSPGKNDEQSGISVSMDAEQMEGTAQIGLIEDVMASVRTLPGVTFAGGWNGEPSVRGGYPAEMATVLDGVYILNPYHWGGSYSIFNPMMVSTVKLSNGIFSAKYGRATSGLLEVTTMTPDAPVLRIDSGISTSSTDLFLQIPLGSVSGLLIGGKVTYLEPIMLIAREINPESANVSVPPYIRDLYAKWFIRPASGLEIYANAFLGTDGVGYDGVTDNDGISTHGKFDWEYLNTFVAGGIRYMPGDKFRIHVLGGYNLNIADAAWFMETSGTREYSQEFTDLYGLSGRYNIPDITDEGFNTTKVQQGQLKVEMDSLLSQNHVISWGVEEVLMSSDQEMEYDGWMERPDETTPGLLVYEPISIRRNTEGNRIIHSAAYLLWTIGTDQTAIRGELGVRGEHFYLWNNEEDYTLNTLPVATPRFNISWVPLRDRGVLDRLTISFGTGLFCQFPLESTAAEKKYGIDDFEVGPNQTLFGVLGAELLLDEGWKFQLEGYGKYSFNRLYVTNSDPAGSDAGWVVGTDGIGYTAGFDLMVQKKFGRKFDGYLTYSFVWSRYMNPTAAEFDGQMAMVPEWSPLDEWYYPSFHRFHNLNLILNFRPVDGLTITVKGALATGAPKASVGEITSYPVDMGGTTIERYGRTTSYSDSLRNDISIPVDVRISYASYFRGTKIRWEYYVGAEDVFTNLYAPRTNKSFDPYTGEYLENGDQADFSIGMPMISFGFKISY